MAIYVTSDLHIGHDKDFLFNPRGFDNVYDHDRAIIKHFNEVLTDDDDLYILGDCMLGDNSYGRSIFNQIPGRKHIILGNHDTDARIEFYSELRGVVDIKYADMIRVGKRHFYLSHYPMMIGNRDHLYNLCGHIHTKDKFLGYDENHNYHVELDAHDMYPVNITDIIEDIKIENGKGIK